MGGSVEVEAEAKVEVVTEEMMEELQEVEASEEGRAGVVEKEEAGEVIAEPPRARARPNVFSMTCRQRTTKSHLHHISTKKICHPFGPRNRPPIPPPISLCLSQVLNRSACSQLPTTASSPKQQAGANFTCVFNI